MRREPGDTQPTHGDARDAVTGPIGGARLVDTTADALSADLDRLTPIDDPLGPQLERVTPIDGGGPVDPEAPTAAPQTEGPGTTRR